MGAEVAGETLERQSTLNFILRGGPAEADHESPMEFTGEAAQEARVGDREATEAHKACPVRGPRCECSVDGSTRGHGE